MDLLDEEVKRDYERTDKLGEGTYGIVYKAKCNKTGGWVAMKRIRLEHEEEGVPSTAIREVSLLKELSHPNVVKLLDVRCTQSSLFLIFEYVEMDLRQHLKRKGVFYGSGLKTVILQLCEGTHCLHAHRILHRDLKPQNILVDRQNRIKIADFGLARAFSIPIKPFTHEVVTLWYRAPEILLGMDRYSTPVDIWSVGCICSEMATQEALFPGDSEIDTVFKIFQVLGTPTIESWPSLNELPDMKRSFPKWRHSNFANMRRKAPLLQDEGVDFIAKSLRYDPIARPSMRVMCDDPWLNEVRREVEILGRS